MRLKIERRFSLYVSFLLLSLVGCSTMQPINSSLPKQEVIGGIEAGDQIEIRTKSGEIRSILVSSISDAHIESGDEQFLIEEIEIVGHRKINPAEKGMAFGAGLAIGVLVQVLMIALLLELAF